LGAEDTEAWRDYAVEGHSDDVDGGDVDESEGGS
jgi:hypothetical protein